MAIPLKAMTRRAKNPRRSTIAFRRVIMPATQATNLYQTVYAPVITAWGNAASALLDEYERTLAQMVTDSPADLQARLVQADGVVLALTTTLRDRLARWARRFEGMHRRKWVASVLSATSVDLSTMIGAEAARMTLETVIERNVALVSSVSDQTRARIADTVYRGLTNRTPVVEVARELREGLAISRRRALNIAADQNNKLSGSLDQERRREVGITTWEWISSGKVHFREEHRARNGREYSDDNPPPELPGQAINCGCTSRAVLHLD